MKATLLSVSALAGAAMAQSVSQSAPFNLVVVSQNQTFNGVKLNACHSGAAIESLCTYPATNASQFYQNITTYTGSTSPVPTGGEPGLLGYTLQGNPFQEPEAMHLAMDISSNVGTAVFFPGNETVTSVAFDKDNLMNLQSYVDDTVTPPNATGPAKSYYRWYICETYFGSYTYSTLAWVYGDKAPQNPSCVKADVRRVFV